MVRYRKILAAAVAPAVLLALVVADMTAGTAEIANWVFKVNGKEDVVQNVNLLSTYNNETLINNSLATEEII